MTGSTSGAWFRSCVRAAALTVLGFVCAVLLLICVAAAVGYRPVVVLTGSMGTTAPPGSLAIARSVDVVDVGDVLVMRREGRSTITHRVVDIEAGPDGTATAITRGDANPDVDAAPYTLSDRELTVRWVVPEMGRLLMEARQPALGLTLVGAVVLAAMAAALRRIWRSDGTEDGAERGGVTDESSEAAPIAALRPRAAFGTATVLGVLVAGGGVAWSLYAGVDTVAANQFSTLDCFDAQLAGVQQGQVSGAVTGITTVPISAVDPTRAFLMYSMSSNSSNPDESMVLGRLASPTSLEFEITDDSGLPNAITVEYSVVEYACGVSVQRGEVPGNGTSQIDVPITPVDQSSSFVLLNSVAETGAGTFGGSELRTVELADPTTVRIRGASPDSPAATYAWQVVSFDDPADAMVQTMPGALVPGALTSSITLPTAVDPATTFVLASVRSADTGPDIGTRMVRARLLDADTVELQRQISTAQVDVVVQIVDLRDGSTVANGILDLAAAETTKTATIPPVQVTRTTAVATVMVPGSSSGGSTSMATDDVAGEASAAVHIDDARTVRVTRAASSAAASFAWQAITWGGPSWADLQSPFRQRIDVTAGSVVTPTGYTTSLVVDHADLVAQGFSLASGDDLRIWRNDGITWTELDRVLDDSSSFDDPATTLWFRTQEPIAAGEVATYWLYFGNASPAAPLADPANVWLVTEGFDDGTLGQFDDRTAGGGWYRALPWTRRISLSIAPAPAPLTDHAVLVQLTSADLAANAQTDGSDIRFTAADGLTPLAHDIEAWDVGTGTLTAWVRVPAISDTVPTQILLFYGAVDAPAQADPRALWSDDAAVWQLAADPSAPAPALDDDGPQQHDGVALADAALVATPTGPGINLDGSNDRMESAPFVLPDGPLTVAAWFRADTLSGEPVLVAQGDPMSLGVFELAIDATSSPTGRIRLRVDGASVEVTGGSVSPATWHHLAATWDGAAVRLYLDGTQVGSTAATGSVAALGPAPVVIGGDPAGARTFDGTIGQVRLDDRAWSTAALSFASVNLSSPSTAVTAAAPIGGTWFDQGDWTVRRPLTVDAEMVAGPLVDYPLLVQLTDVGLASDAQADGDDLVFTAADGVTRLDHQVESWNPATGALTAWVRLPALSDSVDTQLFVYLANPTAVDQQDPVGVWGPDADLVLQG